MHTLTLRPVTESDLDVFFQFQLDPEANHLAAFTSKDPTDNAAYIAKHTRFLHDPTVNQRTILIDDLIVGSIAKFEIEREAEITYWIDRTFWGQGIASTALERFLTLETIRPIYARVAYDNPGSQRVLEKCGFTKIGTDRGFANARQMEIEEFIYRLA